MILRPLRRIVALVAVMAIGLSGCGFRGLNSLPLPGVVGRDEDASTYRIEIANVATLEANAPVLIADVVVGSVSKLWTQDWHAVVEVKVKPDVVVPENAIGTVGQTSLLGSMHFALDPPLGEAPVGRLKSGSTIPLNQSSTYPSTEQTLSSLSAVVNGGALGQVGDIIHTLNTALSGRESQVRELISRLDTFVGTLDDERDDIIASIDSLNRLSSTFAQQDRVVSRTLTALPPALDVLARQRGQFTTALKKLHTFSDTATELVSSSRADLVKNLTNLEPTLKSLADIGSGLGDAIAYATHFPFTQDIIDRAVKGDYTNFYAVVDLTYPRLKRGLFLGTRWGQPGAPLVPAPGDPASLNYTYDPLAAPIVPSPAPEAAAPGDAPPPADAPSNGISPIPELPPPADQGGH